MADANQFTDANDQLAVKYGYDDWDRPTKKIVAWELEKAGVDGNSQEHVTTYDDLDEEELGGSDTVRSIKETDPRDRSVMTVYDTLGRKIKAGDWVNDAFVGATSWAHDKRGNVATADLPLDDDITCQYDALNRPVMIKQGGLTLTQSSYDEDGRLKERVAHRDGSTTIKTLYKYDVGGRLIEKIEDADSSDELTQDSKSRYVYDGFGRVTKIIDARHADKGGGAGGEDVAAIRYEYDDLDRVTKETDPNDTDETTRYEVYSNGVRFAETTLRGGTVVKRKLDELGRLSQVEVDTGSGFDVEQTFTYDALSRAGLSVDYNGDYDGRSKARAVKLTYDHFSRIVQEHQGTVDGNYDFVGEYSVQTEYDRDPAEQGITEEVMIQYADGLDVKRRYDTRGLLKAVGRDVSSTFTPYVDYTLDSQGRISDATFDNDTALAIVYDTRGREVSRIYEDDSNDNIFRSVDTGGTRYDRQGNVKKETIAYVDGNAEVKDYVYDRLSRVTQLDLDSNSKEEWVYDRTGNWTEHRFDDNGDGDFLDAADVNQTREHNAENEIEDTDSDGNAIGEASGTAAWDDPNYDARGNMIYAPKAGDESTKLHFIYDWANRLTMVREDTDDDRELDANDASIASFTYDAGNRLVQKTTYPNWAYSSRYVYNGPQMVEEYENGDLLQAYIFGAGVDDAIVMTAGNPKYYVKDCRLSITALTDSSGDVVEIYRYSAFGHMTIYDPDGTTERSCPSAGKAHAFTGRRWFKHAGLWYFRARLQHPRFGRFLQRDPIGYADGLNLYAYTADNPLSYVDPGGTAARRTFLDWMTELPGPLDVSGVLSRNMDARPFTEAFQQGANALARQTLDIEALRARLNILYHGNIPRSVRLDLKRRAEATASFRESLMIQAYAHLMGPIWDVRGVLQERSETHSKDFNRYLRRRGTLLAYDLAMGSIYLERGLALQESLYQFRDSIRAEKETEWDFAHTTLDIAGMIPFVGEPADLLNAAIYAHRGKWGQAALSAGAAVPGIGWAATTAKWSGRTVKWAGRAMDLSDVAGMRIASAAGAGGHSGPSTWAPAFPDLQAGVPVSTNWGSSSGDWTIFPPT